MDILIIVMCTQIFWCNSENLFKVKIGLQLPISGWCTPCTVTSCIVKLFDTCFSLSMLYFDFGLLYVFIIFWKPVFFWLISAAFTHLASMCVTVPLAEQLITSIWRWCMTMFLCVSLWKIWFLSFLALQLCSFVTFPANAVL